MLCWAGHMDRLLAMPPISLWQPQTDICLCIPEWPPNGSRSPPAPDLCSSCRLPGSGQQLTSWGNAEC